MRNKILIYQDDGTNDIRPLQSSLKQYFLPLNISIQAISADEIIKKESLNDTVLAFFMPGGRATPYFNKLKTLGNDKIIRYVNNGGIYFGICAGAYYAGTNVFFETDIKELAIIQQCELNLINADAVGTLYKQLHIHPYSRDFASSAAVKVRWLKDNESHTAHYHGGPYFKPHGDNVTVLAQYDIIQAQFPAIVMQKHGQGLAVASGLHIENSASALSKMLSQLTITDPHAHQVITELKQGEPSRAALFAKLMQKIAANR